MRRRSAKLVTGIAMLAVAACSNGADDAAGAQRLQRLPIDPASVTVSGISSGGAMATQFHVAHSSLVRGAGLLAASPYRCAEGSVREVPFTSSATSPSPSTKSTSSPLFVRQKWTP